ncbi:Permease of the drug/metabolite transporter (DMT) superfamily [Paenibacillus sp. UNCCL117]|uniref:DMT family transporter n=1 Tax=unclassified Paenibacillus TaxID=185978 RepID=UPI00088BB745|nr:MULTISPECIES: DMT family transporter [unclassified Paenibacillus]SDD69573.1 Permease of the drug/metabolite transporter (DMT) superfamily [Paenibacillus sp. cl123]SFW45167.1 Permease of the drug/metabolite transporter (DMT) superfamily [Paenibacillus sp. UNCCL117]
MENSMIRALSITAAVFVTLLWSSSYILNQYAFVEGVGPFTLAGMRYSAAALTLWVVLRLRDQKHVRRDGGHEAQSVHREGSQEKWKLTWKNFLFLGITGFVLAQGLQYAGQFFLTPMQSNMFLSVGNMLFLLIVDAFWLRELKSRATFMAVLAAMAGIVTYFYPWHFAQSSLIGIVFILLSCVGNVAHLTYSRYLLSRKQTAPSALVLTPMLIGAAGMLVTGFILEGMPPYSIKLILILLWLGPINGALAFTLWTWSQKQLRAYESSLINNLMLLEVALLDILFLGRSITYLQAGALCLVGTAIVAVQLAPLMKKSKPLPSESDTTV